MKDDDNDDWFLLAMLRDHLRMLAADGSEALLNMASWNFCVAGYAARHPYFNRLGLVWRGGYVVFGDRDGFEAVESFFGLDRRAVHYLCGNDAHETGFDPATSFAEAARRCDEIISGDY